MCNGSILQFWFLFLVVLFSVTPSPPLNLFSLCYRHVSSSLSKNNPKQVSFFFLTLNNIFWYLFYTHSFNTIYIYNNIHFLFAGASETNGANNAKSSGGVEKRDTSNRSRGRSSSGRGGTGSLDVFIDRGVVNKVVGKLVSGILNIWFIYNKWYG